MFENLTEKITNVFNTLKGKGIIDESSLNEALREIRIALLESDVSIKVAKDFIERIKEKEHLQGNNQKRISNSNGC